MPSGAKNAVGAVLIGGKSSRMAGAIPKHQIVLHDGRTMLAHVMEALKKVCGKVVVVDRKGGDGLAGVETIRDARDRGGPLAGIEALLVSGLAEDYLVCPCDVPRISGEFLELLLTPTKAAATVVQLDHHELPEPLPARLGVAALPVVRRLLDSGEPAVWKLMEALQAEVVSAPRQWQSCLLNVNTREDVDCVPEAPG